jgi:hypothetical protein
MILWLFRLSSNYKTLDTSPLLGKIDFFSEEFTCLQNIRLSGKKLRLTSHKNDCWPINLVGHLNKEAKCIAVPGLPPGERRVLEPTREKIHRLHHLADPANVPEEPLVLQEIEM